MTRKKVKLAFITNDAARKATYKKRKKGLLKKVNELSTLCGIEACAVIYSPYDNQPELWPTPLGVQRVLAQFKRMPEMEQSKKMVNQETFLKQRINKAKDQLKKLQKENREKEIQQVMYESLIGKGFDHLSMVDLTDLGWMIDQTLKDINMRTESLNKCAFSNFAVGSSSTSNGVQKNVGFTLSGQYEEKPFVGTMYENPNASVVDSNAQRQWLVDLMNSNDQMQGNNGQIGIADQEIMPFGGINHNDNNGNNVGSNGGGGLWSNTFFPWEDK